MRIILSGIIGRYPLGGVAWCSLQYLLGLRRLGHEVWYLEDTGECNFDPVGNTIATDPAYALQMIDGTLSGYGFGDRWCYVDYLGGYHGMEASQLRQVCAGADLFLNLSGGCWFWRDEYAEIAHKAFIDSDPAFTQLALAGGVPWYVDFFSRFDTHFTFGANIATPACPVPAGPMTWHHTWQPVCLDEWAPQRGPGREALTTIMTWRIKSFDDIGGNKDEELANLIDLPSRVRIPLELAITAPSDAIEMLESRGWRCRDPFPVSRDVDSYRDFIRSSRGEFSVAKSTYVRTNSGWFSDRTECYLASGRPAVVQDTGFSAHLPVGQGLFAFQDADQAAEAIEMVVSDPEGNRRAARELARAYFADDVILPDLLEVATSSRRPCA